jgi:hypothetical protein
LPATKFIFAAIMDYINSFENYLETKNIDPQLFANRDPENFADLKSFFDQTGSTSFSQQKLFLVNPLRRLYPLKREEGPKSARIKKSFNPKIPK